MTGGVARVLELEAREELEDRGLALGSRTYQVKLPININYFKYFFFCEQLLQRLPRGNNKQLHKNGDLSKMKYMRGAHITIQLCC